MLPEEARFRMNAAADTPAKGDPRCVARALELSRTAARRIRPNLRPAFVSGASGVPLAAGLLCAFTGWLPTALHAALAMSLGSVSVVDQGLRSSRSG